MTMWRGAVSTNYTYDGLSHLLSVLHQTGSTTLDGSSYGYDYAGNRTTNTNYLNGITSNYAYDAIYELLNVTQGGCTTESYSYDAVGNRLSSSGVPSYSYNTSNELVSTSSGSYTYDANGNTLSDASGKSYTWDFENRMASAVVPGTGTVTFKYDPFGRRIYKSSPNFTGIFAYDGYNLIETMNSSGTAVSRYTYTQNVDEPLAEDRSGGNSYYEADGLGSITSLSSSTGSVANTYTYDSFGNVTNSTGSLNNPFRYTGREFDSETGAYFDRARYYEPANGRFLSEDPIRFWGGVNFYAYVYNSPTNLIDPLGLCGKRNFLKNLNTCVINNAKNYSLGGTLNLAFNTQFPGSSLAGNDVTDTYLLLTGQEESLLSSLWGGGKLGYKSVPSSIMTNGTNSLTTIVPVHGSPQPVLGPGTNYNTSFLEKLAKFGQELKGATDIGLAGALVLNCSLGQIH